MKMVEDSSAKTKTEHQNIAIAFPKYKKGGYFVRKVLTECTYNYVDRLFNALISRLIVQEDGPEQQTMKSPPPLCINFDKPSATSTFSYQPYIKNILLLLEGQFTALTVSDYKTFSS